MSEAIQNLLHVTPFLSFFNSLVWCGAQLNFMPSSRKVCAHKPSGTNLKNPPDSRGNLRNGSHTIASSSVGVSLAAKGAIVHPPCPMTPLFTAIGFEVFYLFYGLCALFVQYINIYKMNYHLIDYHEVLVIALFLMRRIGWMVFKQVVYLKEISSIKIVLMAFLKGVSLVGLLATFIWLVMQLCRTTSLTNLLLLFLYPAATYLWVFGFTLELKLHRLTPKANHQIAQTLPGGKYPLKDPEKKDTECTNGEVCPRVIHNHCSLSPDIVRSEAEGHRVDFNFKMKRALFQSFICAYYVGFIPMRFSKRFFIYYDLWWSCQHVIFVWIGALILLMKYLAPLPYCDSLHRCAVHLGAWTELDEDDEVPTNTKDWSALTIWPQDVVVNYKNKGLYKSLGIQNVADPGDTHHWKFYVSVVKQFVFQSPVRLTNWLLCALSVVIFYQLVLLCKCPLWHEVVSLSALLLFNYAVLFKLLRDRWVAMAMELKPA